MYAYIYDRSWNAESVIIIVSLYNVKGTALERGNYRSLKLLDRVMRVLERVAENTLRQFESGSSPGLFPASIQDIPRKHVWKWPGHYR